MLTKIISMLYSLYYNFKCFDFKTAIKIPLFFSYHVKVTGLKKGCIVLESPARFGMFRMGFSEGSFRRGEGKTVLQISGGSIYIKDTAYIAKSSVINVSQGELHLEVILKRTTDCLLAALKRLYSVTIVRLGGIVHFWIQMGTLLWQTEGEMRQGMLS